MNTINYLPNPPASSRSRLLLRFACMGATLGLGLGLVEAGLLFSFPRFSGLLRPDVDFVIWFVAPLVDLVSGALLGLTFGLSRWAVGNRRVWSGSRQGHGSPRSSAAARAERLGVRELAPAFGAPGGAALAGSVLPARTTAAALPHSLPADFDAALGVRWADLVGALGIGVVGAYLGWLLDWFRIGAGLIFPRRPGTALLVECFLATFVFAFLIKKAASRQRPITDFRRGHALPVRRLAILNLIAAFVVVCGTVWYALSRPDPAALHRHPGGSASAQRDARPNMVLIVPDTVRADHLSCYGYTRRTTPAIDRIASRGTVFENAYAPASWTLASLVSIFTGLLPHQHGADWSLPPNPGPLTLARILRSEGYDTAGFSSNAFYGLGAWRLSDGFDLYVDDSYSVRHNLAATFLGQSVLECLYDRLVHYNQFAQRNAADVNQDIIRWCQHRASGRPFFLFINYMDPHRPYLPPSPFDRRFGEIPHRLLSRLIAPLKNGHPPRAYTARERQEMLDGYDNSLAYLDSQVGRLLEIIKSSASSTRTIIIFTSDHGEGFGEHGTYDHGWNLYREVLHVPLIIEGPGIPSGLRVANAVSNRQLFSTVLGVARARDREIAQTSLARFWSAQSGLDSLQNTAVSELAAHDSAHQEAASLSFATSRWQYIRDSNGWSELYDLKKDPLEEDNLTDRPDVRSIATKLEGDLKAQIAYSVLPWYGPEYLASLVEQGGAGLLEQVRREKASLPPGLLPIGTTQDYISHNPPSQVFRPNRAEQDLLRSLPYH